jgi:hypothetical protein
VKGGKAGGGQGVLEGVEEEGVGGQSINTVEVAVAAGELGKNG